MVPLKSEVIMMKRSSLIIGQVVCIAMLIIASTLLVYTIKDINVLTTEELLENDDNGKYNDGDVVRVRGVAETSCNWGAGTLTLDGNLSIGYAMSDDKLSGVEDGDIITIKIRKSKEYIEEQDRYAEGWTIVGVEDGENYVDISKGVRYGIVALCLTMIVAGIAMLLYIVRKGGRTDKQEDI
jgi:hypothetical protein